MHRFSLIKQSEATVSKVGKTQTECAGQILANVYERKPNFFSESRVYLDSNICPLTGRKNS